MNKRGHLILGFVASLIFILFTGWLKINWFNFSVASVLLLIGISLFYSILPDVDHKSGTITWIFIGLGISGLIFGIIGLLFHFSNSLALLIISTLLITFTFVATNFFEHRGIIHSVPVGFLSTLPLWYLFHDFSYCALAYIAWHSHLLGDGYLFKLK